MTNVNHSLSSTTFASYALEYDGGANTVGNLTEVTELDGSVVTYGYDAAYRLTSETRTGTNAYTKTYTYDAAGNPLTLNGSSFATYDTANKISALTNGTIGYDGDGNTTSFSYTGIASTTFTWTKYDKMDSSTQGGVTAYSAYDAFGIRKTQGSRYFFYDGERLIGEASSGTYNRITYTWGPTGLISQRQLTGTGSPKSLWHALWWLPRLKRAPCLGCADL